VKGFGMPSRSEANYRHILYYFTQLKNIQILFGQNIASASGVAKWEMEKENIHLGQQNANEYAKDGIDGDEHLWFEYTVLGDSFLSAIDSSRLVKWIDSSLNTANLKGDFEKQLALLDSLALVYKYLGQPNKALQPLQDELHLSRKQGNRERECYTLNELGDIYQMAASGYFPFGSTLRGLTFSIHFYRKALKVAREIGHNNEIAYAFKELGRIYLHAHHYKHAIVYFKRALLYTTAEDQRIKRDCLNGLAQSYMLNGKQALAMSSLQEGTSLLSTNTGSSDIDIVLSSNPLIIGTDIKEYLEILTKMLKTHGIVPHHKIKLLLGQASIYDMLGNYKEALSVLEDMRELTKNMGYKRDEVTVLIFLSKIHLSVGNKIAAAKKFQEAAKLIEENGFSRTSLTGIKIILSWPTSLVRIFNSIARFLYKSQKIVFLFLRLRSEYNEWFFRVFNYEEADLDMALEESQSAVRRNPKNIQRLLKLASIHKQLREFELALKEIEKVIPISPNNSKAYNMKGDILDDLKDYTGALECYSKAISLMPNNPQFLVDRGFLQFHHGNLDEALLDFSAASQMRPKQALYYAHCGMALSRLGKKSEAEKNFEKAFQLNAGAYAYIDKAAIAALDLDFTNTASNLKIAYGLNPMGTLKMVESDPCFEKIKNVPAFRKFMTEMWC
jgi:tetratricopeptide (TPR) repeat protein